MPTPLLKPGFILSIIGGGRLALIFFSFIISLKKKITCITSHRGYNKELIGVTGTVRGMPLSLLRRECEGRARRRS